MSISTIANRYARALAKIIIEHGETEAVVNDLSVFARMMAEHEDLRSVFASPVLPTERKRGVLNELLSRLKLRQTSANFLLLLLNNSRLHELDHMLRALSEQLDQRAGVLSAEVTTAREINDSQRAALRDQLKAATGKDVRLQFRTDPQIIGGVVTRIGSVVYDGSIRNQLAQMKQRMMD